MGLTDRLVDGLKQTVQLNERVMRLTEELSEVNKDLRQLDRRITRLETVMELGSNGRLRLGPDSSDR